VWHDGVYTIPSIDHYYHPFSHMVQCGGDIYMVFVQAKYTNYTVYFKSIRASNKAIINYVLLNKKNSKHYKKMGP